MKQVGKYNLFKAISTVLTVGAPIITLACCGETFINEPKASLSAGAVFAILFSALFLKDKLAETFKAPSAFIISCIGLIFVVVVENLLTTMKVLFIVTMITSGVDELTFKRFYKAIETALPQCAQSHKFAGFLLTTTAKVQAESEEING